ncbi:MAG: hypothetical protein IJM45_07150 [Clostridia bacterium]|nr:hypothetical protein [Clostridia bacterium]
MGESKPKRVFDRVILSAGSAQQKYIFDRILPEYGRRYGVPVTVLGDSADGQRTGSGGALLNAVKDLSGSDISQKRILFVLTGGESRRAPGYSMKGKALIGIGRCADGTETLLDRILCAAMKLGEVMSPGLLAVCGDILVDADAVIAAAGRLSESSAICSYDSAAVGSRHGVMFAGADGYLEEYYQKADPGTLSEAARRYPPGLIPVDAGWLYFDSSFVSALKRMALSVDSSGEISLFSDIIPAVAKRKTGGADGVIAREAGAQRLRVIATERPFLHFGTPFEILCGVRSLGSGAAYVNAGGSIGPTVRVGQGSLIDNACLTGDTVVGENCLVSDIILSGAAIPDDTFVFGVRLKDGRYVACSAAIEKDLSAAARNASGIWENRIFCPAGSYDASYSLYLSGAEDTKRVSMADCFRLADPVSLLDLVRYLSDMLAGRKTARSERYELCRNMIVSDYTSLRDEIGVLECVKDKVELSLPVRINFSGTWTDCPPYCVDNGGEVINAAVRAGGELPVRVTAERIDEKRIEMFNADYPAAPAVYVPDGTDGVLSDHSLHRAALRTLGVTRRTAVKDGVRLSVSVRGLMKGSGLGISSIMLSGCFRALSELLGINASESETVLMTLVAEQLMATGGGWQDQGALIGTGLKAVSSQPGIRQRVSVGPLDCPDGFIKELSGRLALISTGQRHFGRFIVTDVMNRYLSGDGRSIRAFARLRELNGEVRTRAAEGDITGFARCMDAQASLLAELSPMIYNDGMLALTEKCRGFVDGCCVCGAGGGGYLAAVMKEGVGTEDLKNALGQSALTVDIL